MERIVGLSLALTSLGLYTVAGDITKSEMDKGIGAAIWPKFLLVCIILLSMGMFISTFFNKNKQGKEKIDNLGWFKNQAKTGLAVLFLVIYILMLEPIGFLAATILLLVSLMRLMGVQKLAVLGLVPTAFSFLLTLVFYKMGVPLPLGTGVFRQFFLTIFT